MSQPNEPSPLTPLATGTELQQLYDEHGAVLLTFLMGLVRGDRYRAEDILQETLVRAWRHPEARTEDGTWSRPWLYTVARRIAIDYARATQVRPPELGDERIEEQTANDDRIDVIGDIDAVRQALAALPDRFRDVLVELYFHDRSVAEVAQLLAIPRGTVKSRVFYAVRALREELLRRGFVEDPPLP